jgi:hypothetical protein
MAWPMRRLSLPYAASEPRFSTGAVYTVQQLSKLAILVRAAPMQGSQLYRAALQPQWLSSTFRPTLLKTTCGLRPLF